MKPLSITNEINTYLPLLSLNQQELVLEMVKNILHIDNKEQRISIEQYNAEIENALRDIKNGISLSHEDVLEQSKKWLKRK